MTEEAQYVEELWEDRMDRRRERRTKRVRGEE